jgi:HlyD family secretion protein
MKKFLFVVVLLWAGGAGGYWYWTETRTTPVSFRTVEVRRGDVLATVNATGTLEPEEVVDVGTQVAGEIQSFGRDPLDPGKTVSYGTHVEKGTVLAQLDDALFKARLDQARAGVSKAEADLEQGHVKLRQTEREFERVRKLHNKSAGMVAQKEYDTALADYESAQAGLSVGKGALAVAQANFEEASVNLGRTTIRSPVSGIVLDRRVNIGQTVVASLNAPSIFLIAKDLGHMQIWAAVNEADVGAVRTGQKVRFTVGAFPHDTFPGRVSQVRLNASMTQNVVTYTVVIDVDNPDGRLLPYMTARVQFEVSERKRVLTVPSAALRWQPKLAYVALEARGEFSERLRRLAASRETRGGGGPGSDAGVVWTRQGAFVRPVPVRTGLSDGVTTEIQVGDNVLAEGSEIVLGAVQPSADEESASPFLPKVKNDKGRR